MKLEAKARLLSSHSETASPIMAQRRVAALERRAAWASVEEPLEDGVNFTTMVDGDEPTDDDPEVQELTQDDGGVETAPEKRLLMDDITPAF